MKEGTLERKVRGPGMLQPREARWLSTREEARVDRVLVRAGETVTADTVIVQLSNPEVERAADAAELEVAAARAEFAAARLELESQRLDRRSSLAEAQATAESARLQAVAEERAFQQGAVSELQTSRSKILAAQLGERVEDRGSSASPRSTPPWAPSSRRARRACGSSSARTRSAASPRIRCRCKRRHRRRRAERAGAGRPAARPGRQRRARREARHAVCGAADSRARRARPRAGPAGDDRHARPPGARPRRARGPGGRSRAPCSVEIDFDEPLPTQARADLSVDGTIAIETLKDVRFVGRPVGAQSDSATTVFRARAGDTVAERVPVKFGKASVNQIVVLEGLEPGDIVALADTTQWSGKDRLVID